MKNRINSYIFTSKGVTDHLKGQIPPDLYKGFVKTAQGIVGHLDNFSVAWGLIQADDSLSRSGKKDQASDAAKDTYQKLRTDREKVNYRGHIIQLNRQLDDLANPKRSTEEKLLRQLQMAEIRNHLAGKDEISIYSDATATGDLLVAEAIEGAPEFMLDPLLPPIIKATLEKRRLDLNPSLTGQIRELELCDAATRLLFNDAELLLGTETDTITDIVNAGPSTEDGADGN